MVVVTYAPQDIHVQLVLVAVRQSYVPLEHFLLMGQQHAAHAVVDMCALLGRLISSEELLQVALDLLHHNVRLDTIALLEQ